MLVVDAYTFNDIVSFRSSFILTAEYFSKEVVIELFSHRDNRAS